MKIAEKKVVICIFADRGVNYRDYRDEVVRADGAGSGKPPAQR